MLFPADTPAAAPAPRIIWLGPFAVTRMETARFNYTNFGTKPVDIACAFSNAIPHACSPGGGDAESAPGRPSLRSDLTARGPA
jgi:hypothetical protein